MKGRGREEDKHGRGDRERGRWRGRDWERVKWGVERGRRGMGDCEERKGREGDGG